MAIITHPSTNQSHHCLTSVISQQALTFVTACSHVFFYFVIRDSFQRIFNHLSNAAKRSPSPTPLGAC